jgi:hypothetical protein
MRTFRKHLTYANVMTTVGVFLLLAGGTAIAAKQLGKKTVGAKQLKSNAVTTAKIKKAAVTKAKIKDGAIDATKLADGSVTTTKIVDGAVTGAKIASGGTVFSQRVARFTPNSTASMEAGPVAYPVGSYTQNAGEDTQAMGALDVRFAASCTPPRSAVAYLLMDAANPLSPGAGELIGFAVGDDKSAGQVTRRFDFGPFPGLGSMNRAAPPSAVPHTFSILLLGGSCTAGTGVDAVGALVDVIGTK